MPLFALAGIPWLAATLGTIFLGLVTFLTTYLTKRFALFVAAMIAIVAVTGTLFAALQALFISFQVALPDFVSMGMALVVPDNAVACITAIISAKLLKYVYGWQVRIIQWKLL